MEEIKIVDLLQFYLKKLPYILVAIAITIISGIIYISVIQTPLYHGKTSVILVQSNSKDNQSYNQNELTLGEKLVSTYSSIIKSKRVLSQVIDELDLKMSTDKLVKDIKVTSVSETAIINIIVSNEDKDLAVKIANKTATVFSKEVDKIYNLENITVLDEAEVEQKPYNINVAKQLVIYVAVAAVVSCIVVFVCFYFSDTIKEKKDIESKLGVPVLGEIPLISKESLGTNYYSKKRSSKTKDIKGDK